MLAGVDQAAEPSQTQYERTCQHDIQHHATGPYVSNLAIILVMHQHFWCNVVRRARDCLRPRVDELVLGITKVAELDVWQGGVAIQQHVLKLDIPA